MYDNQLEIRYYSPVTGYVTEVVNASTTAGAINLIKARVPNATVNYIKVLPPSERRDDSGTGGRRW